MPGDAPSKAEDPGTPGTLFEIAQAHNRRMSKLDPLLPKVSEDGPQVLSLSDGNFGVQASQLLQIGPAAGVAVRRTTDPTTMGASFSALDNYALSALRVGPDDQAQAALPMEAALAQWQEWVMQHREQGEAEEDVAATITWPSRDTAMHTVLVAHGLVPVVDIAVRLAGRGTPQTSGAEGLRIREMAAPDVEAAAALQVEMIRWDAQFGAVTERDSSLPRSVEEMKRRADGVRPSAWVAESDGYLVGLLTLDWPPNSAWIAGTVAADPTAVAYLSTLSVSPGRRSVGVGRALVAAVHPLVDAAGIGVTLLHHSVSNPLSSPFWHSHGYRPLWTIWQARPPSRLRQ